MKSQLELRLRALRALSAWARCAEGRRRAIAGRPELVFYGSGYNAWGVQTNQKYAGAMACLAAFGADVGIEQDWALDRALAALRFSLESHLTGSAACSDGTRWGHTWVSALGIERMMHGIYAVWNRLTGRDLDALQRVITDEAGWLLSDYRRGSQPGIKAGRWAADGCNDPESNIWNGALLWRAAAMYPDHPHAADWRERAHCFLLNGISVAADAVDETVVAGKPIRERHAGANFFDNYALDHHGYLNVGYMVICLSNVAMLHFDLALKALPRPESLDFHTRDLWQTLRRMIFSDGRLCRIGGDTRVRYAYCQDYLMPTLLYSADRLGEPYALELAEAQMRIIEKEQTFNADGSFYGRRLAELDVYNPYYYTRLESDRACVLGQAAAYLPLVKTPPTPATTFEESARGLWLEPEHGAALHRCPKRLVSFAWRAFGLAQGMCLPPGDGHLCDWERNMASQIEFAPAAAGENGIPMPRRLLKHNILTFDGGFLSFGAITEGAKAAFEEGWQGEDLLAHKIVFAALPDERTAVCLEHCATLDKLVYVGAVKGLHFNLANDLFNDFSRTMFFQNGAIELAAPATPAESIVQLPETRWVNCGNRLGLVSIYGAGGFAVVRSPRRRAGAKKSLFVEEICRPYIPIAGWLEPRRTVLDAAWATLAGATADETATAAASPLLRRIELGEQTARCVSVPGADGRQYIVAANFGNVRCRLDCGLFQAGGGVFRVLAGANSGADSENNLELPPGGAVVLCAAH